MEKPHLNVVSPGRCINHLSSPTRDAMFLNNDHPRPGAALTNLKAKVAPAIRNVPINTDPKVIQGDAANTKIKPVIAPKVIKTL